MFIIKFNNMVKNKWIWAAFAIVVAVAFGASDIMGLFGRNRTPEGSLGSLNGKPVDGALFRTVRNLVRFENRGAEDDSAFAPRELWKRYAAIVRAREAGIVVPDAMLADLIHREPAFQGASGAFDRDTYRNVLARLGLTPLDYQEILRAQVALRMLERLVAGGPYAAPAVAELRAAGLNDSFTLVAATFTNAFSAASAEVSPEEARAFYEAHSEQWRVPELRAASYVRFPSAPYRDKVEFSDDSLREYYEENESDFVVKGTNDVEEVLRPFEEVRDEIVAKLLPVRASELAAADAGDFSDLFYSRERDGSGIPDFAAAAAEHGYSVSTTGLFAADARPVSSPLARDMADAVFALDLESADGRVSGVLGDEGGSEYFVAALDEIRPSRVPDYEEVADEVLAAARADAAARSFRTEVSRVQEAFVRGFEENRPFADIAAENGMAVGTNFVFSATQAYAPSAPVPSPHLVAQAMMQLGAGDLCREPVDVPDGVLFFQVVDRKAGPAAQMGQIRSSAEYRLAAETGSAMWDEWLDANLAAYDPQPSEPFDAAADEAEPEDGAE